MKAPPLSPNSLGSLYMVVGTLGYVTNDALIREATESGLDVYQALCLRGIAMSVLFAAVVGRRGERIGRDRITRPLIVRVASELVASVLFFGALIHVDFANAQTILLIVPFAVTLIAALSLGEVVSGRLYATVLLGFVGVILVVQPATDGFSVWSIVILASAGFQVVREFATRRVADDIAASTVALATAVAMAMLTGVIAAFSGWNTITGRTAGLVALAAACLMVGYVFTIQTVRVGDLSVSAPFRYTALPGAVILGYLFFAEIPNALTVAGCVVIFGCGLYAIHVQRQMADPSTG